MLRGGLLDTSDVLELQNGCACCSASEELLSSVMKLLLVSAEREELYTANWDFHPFGAWLANEAAANNASNVTEVVELINNWKASNGEEMHGYLWQSLRLLAYDSGTLDGERKPESELDEATAVQHMLRVCEPTWWLAPQTRDDCECSWQSQAGGA